MPVPSSRRLRPCARSVVIDFGQPLALLAHDIDHVLNRPDISKDFVGKSHVELALQRQRELDGIDGIDAERSEEHTSELQSQSNLVCRLLLEKKNLLVATHAARSKRGVM